MASVIFKNNPLPEDFTVYDGNTGQSVKLEELAYRRAETQNQRFQNNSLSEVNWRILLSKLQDLLNEEYDEDFVEPSQHILKQIAELLFKVNAKLGYEMTLPKFIVPDGDGGIRVEWKRDIKHLRLIYTEKRNYLYFESLDIHDAIQDFTTKDLIEKLRWLNQ